MSAQFHKNTVFGWKIVALPSRGEHKSAPEEIESYPIRVVNPELGIRQLVKRLGRYTVVQWVGEGCRSLPKHGCKRSVSWELEVGRTGDHIETVHRRVPRNLVRMGETSQGDRNPYCRGKWMREHCSDKLRDKDFDDV